MRAMIFAAGLGTRMGAISEHLAKPALPVCGVSILAYALAKLEAAGIDEVVINTFHRGQDVQEAIEQVARDSTTITWSHETPEILGTGGGLGLVKDFLSESGDPFVVMNGDTLLEVDLLSVIAKHRETQALATLVIREDDQVSRYGGLGFDKDQKIWDFVGRAPVPADVGPLQYGLFTGVHVLDPKIFDFIGEGYSCLGNDVYPAVLEAGGKLIAYMQSGYWSDLGTPARYLQGTIDILSGAALDLVPNPLEELHGKEPGIYGDAGCCFPESTQVLAPIYVDVGVQLGEGVTLGPGVVLGNEVVVGDGATLERCIVLSGVEIPAGASYQDAILTPDEAGGLLVTDASDPGDS